jgi:hypothetical protein
MIVAFEGEQVHLVSQQSAEMVLPPSDQVQDLQEQKGFWYELRDACDRPLYRRVMHNPMQQDLEVFSDDPEQSIARQPAPNRKGVFVVVVPDTEEGRTVTLSSSRHQVEQPATEIARFALRKQ